MLKSKFGRQLSSISQVFGLFFAKFGLHPNVWTLLTLVFAVPGFFALYARELAFGLFFFFLSGLIDMIDGAVARATKKASSFGAFLDGVIDRYVEFLLYVGLWFYLRNSPEFLFSNTLWIMLLLFGALMPSFVRAYSHHKGIVTSPKELEAMGGLLERSERLDLIYLGMFLGFFNESYLTYVIALVAVLSHVTTLQRICFVARK
ncbi:MAG: CDP-alcohol phosphatidyltransferase family protein [Candidatus Altiarchaeota archaeon]